MSVFTFDFYLIRITLYHIEHLIAYYFKLLQVRQCHL